MGQFHTSFLHHNVILMANSFCCNFIYGYQIATKFWTCHDSPAVVSCAKFCSDHIRIEMWAKQKYRRIWMVMENTIVKWATDFKLTKLDPLSLPLILVVYQEYVLENWLYYNGPELYLIHLSNIPKTQLVYVIFFYSNCWFSCALIMLVFITLLFCDNFFWLCCTPLVLSHLWTCNFYCICNPSGYNGASLNRPPLDGLKIEVVCHGSSNEHDL